ncbi:MAG: 3-keto-5-aminohexanoate cleavage protein [Candidatus Bathyarchaeota archaeon]|nr:3-keto-5-aminohexanoate cleavage protein [Candidatus Bathyarchaeota archaeon]
MKLIITAAITGGEPVHRGMTPYVPTTVDEITEEAVKCWEVGASIVHLHAKEPNTGKPHPDPNPVLGAYVDQIQKKTNLICNVTTGGGRRASDEALDRMIEQRCKLGQEMMSMNVGTINLWTPPYEGVFMNDVPRITRWAGYMKDHGIKPELEVYDTGMINTAKLLSSQDVFEQPIHIQFVMVGKTGFSPTPKMLIYCVEELEPEWTWSVCSLGRTELPMCAVAMTLGGHTRIGMEDNIYLKRGELLKSNAQLVERIVALADALNIDVASPDEARKILGLGK